VTLTLQADPLPLYPDEHGGLRVGDARIPLERVIEAYLDGAEPDTIVRWFDTLRLADVYAVISYYLNHEAEVTEYLRQRDQQAEEVRRRIEAAQPPRPNLRQELLARQARLMENGDAAPGQ